MVRKRLWLDRPHSHLELAAAKHQAIAGGDPSPEELELEEPAQAEPQPQGGRRRRQARNSEGRFE